MQWGRFNRSAPSCPAILPSPSIIIRNAGIEPEVIDYMKTPPTRAVLQELIAKMGVGVRAVLREKGTPYAELGLDSPDLDEDHLLDMMVAYPILINRPIVVTAKGVMLCRPSEKVLDLLPAPQLAPSAKRMASGLSEALSV